MGILSAAAQPRYKIPPFTSGFELFRGLSHYARPQEKLSVSEFAIKYQGYDPDIFPWQVEVMNALSNPGIAEVGLLGPSQTGKTTIGIAWLGRNVLCDPDEMQVVMPSQNMARIFSTKRVAPMVENTQVIANRLLIGPNAVQTFTISFTGMNIYFSWPVPSEFVQRFVRYEWADDFDQVSSDIGGTDDTPGQGSLASLMRGRMTSFEGRSKLFISSTPADDNGGKTEAFVRAGTFEKVHPECPSCGDRWEIDAERDLKFDQSGSPDKAAETAHVICGTGNGCVLNSKDRRSLLTNLKNLPYHGFVRHNDQGNKGQRTFWIDGLLCMSSWGEIARQWRSAQIEWAQRQDESGLRTLWQTKFGKNYRSLGSGEKPLITDDIALLKDNNFKSGIVPPGPCVWTLAVDVQGNRFDCAAIGYADGHEAWLIKRWTIDVLEDGLTTLQPFLKPEHWRILLPLFDKTWPVEGGGRTPPPLCVAIDTGGGGDRNQATATENAKKFWRLARESGVHPSRIMLLKGASTANAELVRIGQFSDRKVKGQALKGGPVLWLINVHKIKNIMDARLRRIEPGPGRLHLPVDLENHHLNELASEEIVKGKWVKRRDQPRNETWDLIGYAWAALIKPPFAKTRDNMRWVPKEYRIDFINNDQNIQTNDKKFHIIPNNDRLSKLISNKITKKPEKKPQVDWINGGGSDW